MSDPSRQSPSANSESTANEALVCRRLGIPGDAERVLVFAESSHWDPNWLRTSEEYFTRFVCRNLDQAVDELLRDPRRVYSVECMFFLRMYWDRRPSQRSSVRDLVNEGRMRLTSSGVTTADTVVPRTEAILRDLLVGQEWLRGNGMNQEPRLAYFADSFGCSPALPSLLRAAGFEWAAITRIDGMYFPGCDYERRSRFPRPGSSAERLAKGERSLDFTWVGPDGAEVLCHWNAFTYGQGDLLAHRGVVRTPLLPLAFPHRSEAGVARRVERFAAQLAPYSRTRYAFCPIGFDFVGPISDLLVLLDRYNRVRYPETGIWVVNAGLDDYMMLVGLHRDRLPALELDPNPYWTGFYTSRPALKKACHAMTDLLLLAERLALLPQHDASARALVRELSDAWWYAAATNHHDCITGTSPDRIADGEQRQWVERATRAGEETISQLARGVGGAGSGRAARARAETPQWRSIGKKLRVRTPHYVVELDEERGGAVTRLCRIKDGVPQPSVLSGASDDLIRYRDTGGLWRMGHEFRGGALRERARASDRPAHLEVAERDGELEVSTETRVGREDVRLRAWFSAHSPVIRFRIVGRAPEGDTLAIRFATGLATDQLSMDAAGGVVVRPRTRIYQPTFWAVQSFVHIRDRDSDSGLALFLGMPGAVSYGANGRLECVALRNATWERAFGFLPIPACPASGHERSVCAFDYAITLTPAGDWHDNQLPRLAHRLLAGPWDTTGRAELRALAESVVTVDRPDVFVLAVKPAWRGEGVVARLSAPRVIRMPVNVALSGRVIERAFLCDARERDLYPLRVQDGMAQLTMPGSVASVRLLWAQ